MRKHLPALTGLRFLLAIHVVLFHFSPAFEGLPEAIGNFIGSGYVAVPMFFVLSGFVLTYTYGFSGSPASLDRRKFWFSRVARIYPLYLAALLFTSLYSLIPPPGDGAPDIFDPWAGLAQIFTIHTWVPSWALTWNLPSWSIGIEFFFYLTFPFFALQMLAQLKTKSLTSIIMIMWLIGTAVPVLYVALDPDGIGLKGSAGMHLAFSEGFWLQIVKFNPLVHLPEFVIGVAVGGIFLSDLRQKRRRNGARMTMVAAVALVLILTQSDHIPYPLIHNTALAPFIALLILGLAHGGGSIARVLSTRGFVVLGNASYAIYILQFPLAVPIFGAGPDFMTFPVIAVYVTLLTSLAILAEKFLERPCRRYLKQRFAGGPADASADAIPASPAEEYSAAPAGGSALGRTG